MCGCIGRVGKDILAGRFVGSVKGLVRFTLNLERETRPLLASYDMT